MRGSVLAVLAWAGLALGCSQGPREQPAPAPAPKVEPEAAAKGREVGVDAGAAPRSARAPRPARPAPRVAKVSPGVTNVAAGEPLPERDVALAAGQELVIDFDAGTRVHLFGPCHLRTGRGNVDALLVRGGTLSVDLPPGAPSPESGFTLTTPSATFGLIRAGTFALRNLPDGTSVAFVIAGSVGALGAGAAAPEPAPLLAAGDRADLQIDGNVKRARHSARTLAEIERAAAALRARGRDDAVNSALAAILRARTETMRTTSARMRSLSEAHKQAVAAQAPERMELQSELASQAAVKSRARTRLMGALEQQRAASLGLAQPGEERLAAEAEAESLIDPAP